MTKKQIIERVTKLYNKHGSINLDGMKVPFCEGGKGALITLDRVCIDDDELGVMCVGNTWFIPLDELTYRELEKIIKIYKQ